MSTIETTRLLLREWRDGDVAPFYAMGQDSRVMEHFPNLWSMEMVTTFIKCMSVQLLEKNYTLWAVEEKESHQFIGFIGLNCPLWEAHFTPCVEIGWRLAAFAWGNDYATEGAKAVLDYGFNTLKLEEIVAFTSSANVRSIRVMEKIGMRRDLKGDFFHPLLEPTHRVAQHILFRIKHPLVG